MSNERTPRVTPQVTDFSRPVDKTRVDFSGGECLGVLYNARAAACGMCADNELCIILMRDTLDTAAKYMSETKYLDLANMAAVTDEVLVAYCKAHDGESVNGLIDYIMELANISDTDTAVGRVAEFKATGNLKISKNTIKFTGNV